MLKILISKFMAKTLIAKIVITTSAVVVVGGSTIGAIFIPKYIEVKQEEERQEQLRIEKEEDLANMSITLKLKEITLPYNGVTQGVSIERYDNLEKYLNRGDGSNTYYGDKEGLHKELINFFIENYKGGEISVEENIDVYTRGDYPVVFTLTSEKGNTKTETAIVTVFNYFRPLIRMDKTEITITKGEQVDLMEGVTFDSNLPKEERGQIEINGTVDTNTVGTYTITYTYKNEGEAEATAQRTYKVIEKSNVKLNTKYTINMIENIGGEIIFTSANKYKYTTLYSNGGDGGTTTGTYTVKGNRVTLRCPENWGDATKDLIINNSNNTCYWDLDYENLE